VVNWSIDVMACHRKEWVPICQSSCIKGEGYLARYFLEGGQSETEEHMAITYLKLLLQLSLHMFSMG
jgi:hypothetical protein